MVKKLIINADDFGMTEGVSKGIIDSFEDGVLTSTTLLVNGEFSEFAIAEAKKHPGLGLGIHLALTIGRPVTNKVSTLTNEAGDFWRLSDYHKQQIAVDLEELYMEWQAQMEEFIRRVGKKPTHIDSHHHVHTIPRHYEVVARLAKEYDLPVRDLKGINDNYEDAVFMKDFYGESLTVESLTDSFKEEVEIMEVMTHPAYLDQRTYDMTAYHVPRIKEMDILRSAKLREFIVKHNIQLITFDDLRK